MSLWLLVGLAVSAGPVPPDPAEWAQRIDARLDERFVAEGVVPAGPADDAEFLRRASLDLIGRIPTSLEVRTFLADSAPDKRAVLIDRLLGSPAHARHFAHVWRALLLPEAETEPQVQYFVPGFEAWLEKCRQENTPLDAIVRELLTAPIAGPDMTPEFVLRDLRRPNPLAFIASKDAEPAKIASSSVRLFLGLRLECAQCHDHPFDHWTRRQFWNQAAFFAGLERKGKGTFAPLIEMTDRQTIALGETTETVPARFLDLSQPQVDDGQSARIEFARWMTAAENPFFAQAAVNRIWSQFLGQGFVNPVDDFRDGNGASHPELLRELGGAFAASGFDVTFLIRSICRTRAYQRTSRQRDPGQQNPELFARMAVKSLSGEQMFESLALATGHEAREDNDREDGDDDSIRRRVLRLFANEAEGGDPETSVAQSLALMNGSVIQRAVVPDTGRRLRAVLDEFPDAPDRQIEALCLATLGRTPAADEQEALQAFYQQAGPDERERRLGDIFWALLNSPEFRWNH